MNKFIYLVRSEETGKYKIGISKNPVKRLKQLQTGNGEKLKLIETYLSPHYSKIETNLHNKYSYLKEQGEWFKLTIENELSFKNDCQKIENNIKILLENGNPFL